MTLESELRGTPGETRLWSPTGLASLSNQATLHLLVMGTNFFIMLLLLIVSGSHRLVFQNNRLLEETKTRAKGRKSRSQIMTGTDVPTAAAAGHLAGRLQYFQTDQRSITSLAPWFSREGGQILTEGKANKGRQGQSEPRLFSWFIRRVQPSDPWCVK